MSDLTFSLELLYRSIEARIGEAFPAVNFVKTCPDIGPKGIPLPAILLEPVEFEPGEDTGTGETALVLRFEARVIVAPELPGHYQKAAHLASQLSVLLRAQTWGLEVDFAQFVQARQDFTKPDLDGYTVWVVEWTQQVYLGEVEWLWPDEPPGTLYLNVNGNTGLGNEAEYFRPEELP